MPIAKMQVLGGYLLQIPGTNHINLSDASFSGSLFRDTPGLGKIEKHRGFEILSQVAAAFFTANLSNQTPMDASALVRAYPEITLKTWLPQNAAEAKSN